VPLAFKAAVFIKARNLQPNMAGALSIQSAQEVFPLDTVTLLKKINTALDISCSSCSFQKFAKQKFSFYVIVENISNINNKLS
jgi:hypothetical protein